VGVSIAWIFRARERAQMNGTPPEANTEYSRAPGASRGRLPGAETPDSRAREVHRERLGSMIAGGGLLAALLLLVAEFTTLFTIRQLGRSGAVRSVTTGSHHDFALIPIALLVAVLAVSLRRGSGRPALLALAALAVITLLIALLVDLPDAHRTGLISAGGRFQVGRATPGLGFYLETLAAAVLLLVSGMGIFLGIGAISPPQAQGAARRRRPMV
jgi:hypothetical protein